MPQVSLRKRYADGAGSGKTPSLEGVLRSIRQSEIQDTPRPVIAAAVDRPREEAGLLGGSAIVP